MLHLQQTTVMAGMLIVKPNKGMPLNPTYFFILLGSMIKTDLQQVSIRFV